jgi:hypothetical protein
MATNSLPPWKTVMATHGAVIDAFVYQESFLAVRRLYCSTSPPTDIVAKYALRVSQVLPVFYSRCVCVASVDALKAMISNSLYKFLSYVISQKSRGSSFLSDDTL